MLNDPELFQSVENGLRAMGTIKAFEDENGPILGRVMITLTEIPKEVNIQRADRENLTAFEASFDFCNIALGVAVDTRKKTLESSVWGRYQVPGAERPSDEWVKFFIQTLFEHIADDGSFGIPMYSFVNNTADFTAIPTAAMPRDAVLNEEAIREEPEGEEADKT